MPWVVDKKCKRSKARVPSPAKRMASKTVAVSLPLTAIEALDRLAKSSRPIRLGQQWPLTICVSCMTACYFLQSSVLTVVIPSNYFNLASYSFLCLVGVVIIAVSGLRFVTVWPGLFVACAFVSSLTSSFPAQSFAKCAGLAIVIVVLGPSLCGQWAFTTRKTAWRASLAILVLVGISSVVWYLLGLPVMGRGVFTGVMMHSMLVGPISGMASLVCFNRAFYTRSRGWLLLGLLCVFPCLLAASRIAFVALVGSAGCLIFLLSMTAPRAGIRLLSTFGLGTVFLGIAFIMIPSLAFEEVSQDLLQKSGNSRTELWTARLHEFASSPLLGYGIGVGEGAGFLVNQGKINIEPGSTYLAVLSMTGLVGTVCICVIGFSTFRRVWIAVRNGQSSKLTELASITTYLAIHGLAEGWLLAVGSPLCLLAWLCLGRASDLCPPIPSLRPTQARSVSRPYAKRSFALSLATNRT